MPHTIYRILMTLVGLSGSLVLAEQPNPRTIPKNDSFQVWYHDGRRVKLVLQDEHLSLITPKGDKILIPTADIWRIDFGLSNRLTNDVRKQLESAINDLGSERFKRRRAATATLRRLGKQAYAALLKATTGKDLETVNRAKDLLSRMFDETFDEEMLADLRQYDIVQTAFKRIVGRIPEKSLKAHAEPAGDFPLELAEVQAMQSLTIDPDAVQKAQPDPGNLTRFRNEVGKTFVFKVTGAIRGQVWGTKVYTNDSALATAAVHAGLVKVGQTKNVRVKILGPLQVYQGTQQHGVASWDFGPWDGSYQFIKWAEKAD